MAATFASSALKVLESGLGLARDTSLKATLLRLLSNLADYRETVSLVTNYSSLLDKVVLLLNDGDKQIYENALRVIRQIVKQKNQIKVRFPYITLFSSFSMLLCPMLDINVESEFLE